MRSDVGGEECDCVRVQSGVGSVRVDREVEEVRLERIVVCRVEQRRRLSVCETVAGRGKLRLLDALGDVKKHTEGGPRKDRVANRKLVRANELVSVSQR